MLPVMSPSSPLSWLLVCDDFASSRIKSSLVVIHKPVVLGGGRELRMQPRRPKEIQRDFCLWQEYVPQVHWEGWVN
jgi:hypothetical protein